MLFLFYLLAFLVFCVGLFFLFYSSEKCVFRLLEFLTPGKVNFFWADRRAWALFSYVLVVLTLFDRWVWKPQILCVQMPFILLLLLPLLLLLFFPTHFQYHPHSLLLIPIILQKHSPNNILIKARKHLNKLPYFNIFLFLWHNYTLKYF